jgi:hypothetical protein
VLRETTSRGLCGLGCSSRTSECGGEGDCVKEGGGGEGKCERERALERLQYSTALDIEVCSRGVCLLLQYRLQSCSREGKQWRCVCLLL